jgi:hypothetical protein
MPNRTKCILFVSVMKFGALGAESLQPGHFNPRVPFPSLRQAYAASFFGIPLVRWLLNRRRNAAIEAENEARVEGFQRLQRPDAALRDKLTRWVPCWEYWADLIPWIELELAACGGRR